MFAIHDHFPLKITFRHGTLNPFFLIVLQINNGRGNKVMVVDGDNCASIGDSHNRMADSGGFSIGIRGQMPPLNCF